MTKLKRFGLIIDHTPFFKRNRGVKGIIDNKTDKRYNGYEDIKELLNELYDENEQLKQENKKLKQAVLFYMDVATLQTSSNWNYDMDYACQKIFNKPYLEMKDSYKNIHDEDDVFDLF